MKQKNLIKMTLGNNSKDRWGSTSHNYVKHNYVIVALTHKGCSKLLITSPYTNWAEICGILRYSSDNLPLRNRSLQVWPGSQRQRKKPLKVELPNSGLYKRTKELLGYAIILSLKFSLPAREMHRSARRTKLCGGLEEQYIQGYHIIEENFYQEISKQTNRS